MITANNTMRVLTFTGNLLAETTAQYESWQIGGTARATRESFQVGGKGINVARMLRRLGVPAEALCFPGGHAGARCEEWLKQSGIPFRTFRTAHETRAGWVVRTPGQQETTFLGADNRIDTEAAGACAQFLNTRRGKDCLAICGSMPHWPGEAWPSLQDAFAAWSERAPLAVDSYGPALASMASLPCALVKVNRQEFAGFIKESPESMTAARLPKLLGQVAASTRVERWIVTDGPRPVWAVERGGAPFNVVPPRVQEVSPTGSGDVLFAALIEAIFTRKLALSDALEFALPLAAANAASPGVADFDLTPFRLVDHSA